MSGWAMDDVRRHAAGPVERRRLLLAGAAGAGTCLFAFGGPRDATAAEGPDLFDVRKLGAVGDGTTDATSAVQGAIDEASVRGGTVYFPSGRYRITQTLVFPAAVPIQVVGDGPASEILWTCDGHLLDWTHADGCRETTVRHLKITASMPIGPGKAAIHCGSRVERSLFDSLLIWGEGTIPVPVGIDMGGLADSTTLRDCQIWGVGGEGIRIGHGSQIVVAGGRVIGYGMQDTGSTGVRLTGDNGGVHLLATDLIKLGEGLRIENASGSGSNREVFLTHATLDSCRRGLGVYDGCYVSISGCWAASCSRENVFIGSGAPLVNVTGGTVFNAGAVHVDDPEYGAHGIVVHSGSLLLSGVALRANRDAALWVADASVREYTLSGCLVAGNGQGVRSQVAVPHECVGTLFRDNRAPNVWPDRPEDERASSMPPVPNGRRNDTLPQRGDGSASGARR